MPTLNDIQQKFQSLAKINVQKKPNRAVASGKLRDSIRVIKTRTNKAGGAIFDLNTIYYGVFVEMGTLNMPARPFGQEAADSKTLKKMVDDYFKSEVELTLMKGVKEMDKRLKKYAK